jgi:hypothetical protein
MRVRTSCRLIIGSLCVFAVALPASAHLTGVFAHFVEDMNSPTASTRMLRQQLSSVTERIDALQPEVQDAQARYNEQALSAVQRIRFFDVYAGSAMGALWAGAQDPIDVIASTELMQQRLGKDLDALSSLGTDYAQLQLKDQSLRRYAELLKPFSRASEARDARLESPPEGLVSPFAEPYIAYAIAEDWEQLRATTFVLYFQWAARNILDLGVSELLDRAGDSAFELNETALNALVGGSQFPFIRDAQFLIRADHIYFSAVLDAGQTVYHLLTIGQLERTGPSGFQYRVEAIFMDGMPIDPGDPDVQREVYQGRLLGIDLDPLLPRPEDVVVFEQQNGSIRFAFRSL